MWSDEGDSDNEDRDDYFCAEAHAAHRMGVAAALRSVYPQAWPADAFELEGADGELQRAEPGIDDFSAAEMLALGMHTPEDDCAQAHPEEAV